MTAITLKRIDTARRINRFYLLVVQPDLFGQWSLMREWGRVGRSGQTRMDTYPTEAEAEAAFTHHRYRKERRGYC